MVRKKFVSVIMIGKEMNGLTMTLRKMVEAERLAYFLVQYGHLQVIRTV